ncbi:type VII secretion target [Gordonia insulae]|uniref:ESX-1 secretion-associated protein n=1 Tax=Gordonia insulae TaxID=2420509 RepID=A0A3G8JIM9_9ACTN|nr:type VII secretion target [Gordonia insulae]AZG44884.1 hypothetical protein D7316_01476 [Gordonia insulae]
MTEVTANPHALDAYARGQQSAAGQIRAQVAHQRGDIGALTTTFGVIGADFLSATAYVLDGRARTLDTVAQRHADQDAGTRSAARAYVDADDVNAARMPSAGPDRELRL